MSARYSTSLYRHGAPPCVHQAGPVVPRPSLIAKATALASRSSDLPFPARLRPPARRAVGPSVCPRPQLLRPRITFCPAKDLDSRLGTPGVVLLLPSPAMAKGIRQGFRMERPTATPKVKRPARRSSAAFCRSSSPRPFLCQPTARARNLAGSLSIDPPGKGTAIRPPSSPYRRPYPLSADPAFGPASDRFSVGPSAVDPVSAGLFVADPFATGLCPVVSCRPSCLSAAAAWERATAFLDSL